MATLYEIEDDFHAVNTLLEENGGDISDPEVEMAIQQWFDENEGNLKNKVGGYVRFIKELEAQAKARKDEADRLAKTARAASNKAKWLKDCLAGTLSRLNVPVVTSDDIEVKLARKGGLAPMDIHEEVPAEFTKIKVEPDNAKIREALANGPLPFACLMERGWRLSIK